MVLYRPINKQTVFFLLICFNLLVLNACLQVKDSFGGTKEYTEPPSDTSPSVNLEELANLLFSGQIVFFHWDIASYNSSTSPVSMVNKIVTFPNGITGPIDLFLEGSANVSINSDFVEINPTLDDSFFQTPLAKMIQGDSVSFFTVLDAQSIGEILSLNPMDRNTQSFSLRVSGTHISTRFTSSLTDYIVNEATNPGGTVVVGVSFNSQGEIDLSINGALFKTSSSYGVPGTPFQLQRLFSLGPVLTTDSLRFKEVVILGRSTTRIEQGAMIEFLRKKHNLSFTLDTELNPPTNVGGGGGATDANFTLAKNVIQNRCLNCHTSWGNVNANYFVNIGVVIKNNPLQSKLYYRLKNSLGGSGPKNMPQAASIPSEDVEKIRLWIENMP